MSAEELEEAERRIDKILAEKKKLSEATEVSFDGPVNEPEDYHPGGIADQATIEAEINDILAGRKKLTAEELALQERRAKAQEEAARRQQGLEEEKQKELAAQEAETQRLISLKESAVVADQRMVDAQQEQAALTKRLTELKRAGGGYG